MSNAAQATVWGPDFPTKSSVGVSACAVRLVALAIADVVNDMHDNEFWGTVGKLADKTGLSRETTGLAIKHLVAADVIQLLGDRNGGSNHYRWVWKHVGVGGVDGTTRQPVDGTTRQGLTGPPVNIKPIDTKEISQKENTRFAEFWEMYPRRRRLGKPSALKAWKKIAPEERDAVLVGLAAWTAKWDRDRTEPAFIKTPAPWLNDRRWEDIEAVDGPPVSSEAIQILDGKERNVIDGTWWSPEDSRWMKSPAWVREHPEYDHLRRKAH